MKKLLLLLIAILFPLTAFAQVGQFIPFLRSTLSTTTSATTTNLFSTKASSSNLFTANFQGAGLSTCTGTNALTYSGGLFSCTAQPQGTVTAVSVASANGFSGSSSGGATPALTLTTSITGVLKGDGTAISAASNGTDYTLISATTCSGTDKVSAISAAGSVTCSADVSGGGGGGGGVGFASSTDAYFNNQSIYMYGQGYTGFGTTTPRWLAQLASSTAPQLALTDPSAPLNSKHWLLRSAGGNLYIGTSSDALTSTSTYLSILGVNGNVGIGSTTPFAKLTVDNTGANIVNPVLVLKQQTGGTANVFEVRDPSNALYFFVNSFGNGQSNQGWNFQGTAGSAPSNGAIIVQATANTTNGATIKQTAGASYTGDYLRVLNYQNSAVAALTNGGNFIVGTNTTPYRLAVQGNLGSTTDLFVISTTTSATYATSSLFKVSYLGEASTTSMVISGVGGSGATTCLQASATGLVSSTGSACGGVGSSPGGSDTQIQYNDGATFGGASSFVFNKTLVAVGIGTATPNRILTISTSTRPQIALTDGSLTTNHWNLRSAGNTFAISTSSPSTFATSTVNAITVNANGLVGIGKNVPTSQLDVAGTATIGGLLTTTGNIRFNGERSQIGAGALVNTAYVLQITTDPGGNGGTNLVLDNTTSGANTSSSLGFLTQGSSRGNMIGGQDANAIPYLSIGTSATEQMRLFRGTHIGIGTTTPNWSLQIASSTRPQLALSDSSSITRNHWTFRNAGGFLYIATSSPSTMATSSIPAVTFGGSATSYGLGVASSSPWTSLDVVGRVAFNGLTTSTAGNAICILASFELVTAGANTCVTSSIKTKHGVSTLDVSDKIMKLRPVKFTYNESGETHYGLIAEEVEKVDPLLVEYANRDLTFQDGQVVKKGEPITVDYQQGIVALLVKEVQKIIADITGLRQQLDDQERRIKLLEEKLK